MATIKTSKLHLLYTDLPHGVPITSAQLAKLGISADLAVHYERAGWLIRLGRGVYYKPGETLALHPSLLVLEHKIAGIHVGGKTALQWYGVNQYVAQHTVLQLYGWVTARVPEWFTTHFPNEYHRKRLFEETPERMLRVGRFENRNGVPKVSSPERALLELLSEVGTRQPLQEAREITETTYNFRADVLTDLLTRCTSVKTVRLCLQLGTEMSLPWAKKLNAKSLPTGSNRSWVARSKNGLLVLKP